MKTNLLRKTYLLVALGMLTLVSCGTHQEIAYIHDATRDNPENITGKFTKGIQANDLLSIYVESETRPIRLP